MMKKTAIALGLAMVSGLSLAAQNGAAAGASTSTQARTQASAGKSGAGIDVEASINTQFDALDTNGDGVLSRAEAQANPRVSSIYDSLNTSDTIEDRAKQSAPNGITRDQFQAGMQADASGSGSLGPAASGGETYTIMRDGSRKLKEGATGAGAHAQGAASAVTGKVRDTATQAGSEVQSQRERAQQKADSLQQRARSQAQPGSVSKGRVESSTAVQGSGSYGADAETKTRIDTN